MRLNNKVNWFLAGLLVLALFAMAAPAWASDDDEGIDIDIDNTLTGGDTIVNAGDMIGGDTALSTSSKTFAFSHSLGDVDINEGQNCLGSEAWGSFIVSRQTNELNPWCAALFYELNGKHLFAAKMRCDIKEISKKYGTDQECWQDQNLAPAEPLGEGSSGVADSIVSHIDEAVEQHDEDLMQVQMAQSGLEQRIEALEHKPAPRPRIVQQEQAPPPEQYTAEDKAYILGLYTKGDDEDE